ncbi:stress response protein [Aeromonas phage BUCT695]|uniref:stress response protein n=1 Tax=Aeromonas phage BUCT695 TaxID=2908630 RepID=UPI00232955B2|nr:stress response protein [Aeromonas phage BUCT695]UIW10492.1 stress response protein [Aeromonas phage BUCT695]
MAVILKKAGSINLTKAAAGLTKVRLGLSWDESADLDAVAMVVDQAGKLFPPAENNIAYYGNCTGNKFKNPENPVVGITHSGDARDGSADGDDETITIDLTKVQQDRVIIAVTSYSEADPVPFAASVNPVAKLYDDKGNVLVEVKLDQDAAFSTAVEFVELKRENGEWIFTNITNPVGNKSNGLEDLMALHG